jgi:hypothetical protein
MFSEECVSAGRAPRLVLRLVLGAAILAASLAAAHAQTKVTVPAGVEKPIATASAAIEKFARVPAVGDLTARSYPEGSKFDLMFKAPEKVPDSPIEVSYTAAGKVEKVLVTVEGGVTPEPTSVMVGTERALVQDSTTLISNDKATLGQVAVRSAGDPKKYELVYIAPKDGAGKKDEVSYAIGGKEFKVSIALTENLWGTGYEAAFKVLFAMFVLAALLELGLAVLFNYRYFLQYFDASGTKTIVSVFVAYTFVRTLDLDVVAKLVNVVWLSNYSSSGLSKFISALILAGGSATVNTLMVTLGFRAVRTSESIQRRPPANEAWLAVMVSKGPNSKAQHAEIRLVDVEAQAAARVVAPAAAIDDAVKAAAAAAARDAAELAAQQADAAHDAAISASVNVVNAVGEEKQTRQHATFAKDAEARAKEAATAARGADKAAADAALVRARSELDVADQSARAAEKAATEAKSLLVKAKATEEAAEAAKKSAEGVANAAALSLQSVPLPFVLLHRLNALWPEWTWRLPFVRNPGRFPGWGGHSLAPGTVYQLEIQGLNAHGVPEGTPVIVGPFTPARGAIIDIKATL